MVKTLIILVLFILALAGWTLTFILTKIANDYRAWWLEERERQ
jgi:hypothetical protein